MILITPPDTASPIGKVISQANSSPSGKIGVIKNPINPVTVASTKILPVNIEPTKPPMAISDMTMQIIMAFLYFLVFPTYSPMVIAPQNPMPIIIAPNIETSTWKKHSENDHNKALYLSITKGIDYTLNHRRK